ncbi:hypothetical protein Tco_0544923 [Tanacetum coccineum]
MTNKIDTVLKAIIDRITGTLPNDTVKNSKLSTYPVLFARSYPTEDPQCSTQTHGSINAIQSIPSNKAPLIITEKKRIRKKMTTQKISTSTLPTPSPIHPLHFINKKVQIHSFYNHSISSPITKTETHLHQEEDGDVMFIEIIPKDDNSRKEEPKAGGHVHVEKAYIDLNSPLNIMTQMMYNWIMRKKLDPMENTNGRVSNFTGRIKGMHVFIGNFTYIVDFMIIEVIRSIIDPRLSQVVLGKPFVEISNMTHDPPEGVVRFTNRNNEVAYKMPHKIEQYDSL